MNDAYLYDAKYFGGYQYDHDPLRAAMYEQERKRVLERSPNGGMILDVGCGTGSFLSGFDDRWTRYGYDPSEYAAEKAAQKGIAMILSLSMLESDVFDVIIFRGTLQHISTPIESLAEATRLLKPGGLLVILATPDADSLVYKLFGNLPALDAPKNWIVFGARMLENILKRLRYSNAEILHPYIGTPYARPLKDFASFGMSLLFGWRKFAFPGNQMEVYARKD